MVEYKRMKKVLIAGGSGLVGQALIKHFPEDSYHIHILSRSQRQNTNRVSYFQWDLDKEALDLKALEVDIIINLTGAGIADKRWSKSRKEVLIESRTKSAALIAKGLEQIDHKVDQYIGASAIGFYGSRSSEWMTEEAMPGEGFLSECALLWEEAHQKVKALVNHWSIIRIGIVLSHDGGALPKMLMTKSIGVYNYFGDGQQYYSWIHIEDLCRLFVFLIDHQMDGVYNGTAPEPVTNKAMMESFIRETHLSGILIPAPAFALKLAMGEMSAVVLDSCRASSQKIQEAGFSFEHSNAWDII